MQTVLTETPQDVASILSGLFWSGVIAILIGMWVRVWGYIDAMGKKNRRG